ncbi:MAG: Hsp70 family protein, partial [Chitinophagaceae bacterium]|nr:Hsp70 family protein [Anaerolineae bacterium]
VEVTFDIDANGILNVSAMDKASGRQQKITITAGSGLREEEVERMVKEAEKHAAEDAKRKESAEVKNQAESTIFSAEKLLRDYGDKLPEDAKKRTNELIEALRLAESGDDVDAIRSASDALTQHIQTLGGSMYQQGADAGDGSTPNGGDTGSGKPQDENVIDAEFTDA